MRLVSLIGILHDFLSWFDMFLIRDFFHRLDNQKNKVAFVIKGIQKPYNCAMASTRLRAYDIINYLNQTSEFSAELYKGWKEDEYDVAIFQKYFDHKAYELANRLKRKGIKIILDINVNYYERSSMVFVHENQKKDIFSFTELADGVIASTEYLEHIIAKHFPTKSVVTIHENISEIFFEKKKTHRKKDVITLLYVGYSAKSGEILLIKDVLEELGKKYRLQLLFICDKDPKIKFENIPSRFVKYEQNRIQLQLMDGDIKVSPRNTEDPYNRGHSFTKIGYPMAAGIPVVASPIDSYKNSPAILCASKKEWEASLGKLIADHEYREELSIEGVEHCKNFSLQKLGNKYEIYLARLMKDK